MKKMLTLIPIVSAVFGAPLLCAQKTTTIDVTTTVFDSNGATQLLMRSDDHNGTGQATYTTGGNGGTSLSSILTSGSWQLFLGNQTLRTLYLTPNDPVGSQPVGPPPGYYWENVEAYSQCYDQDGNIVLFQSLVNGSNNCSLGVDFYAAGKKYKLVMSPHLPAAGPATGLASVACNTVSNSQCVSWTISPNTVAANPTVSNLYYYPQHGSLVFVGQYYNTYLIRVTNP
jgi:hypothetical protein